MISLLSLLFYLALMASILLVTILIVAIVDWFRMDFDEGERDW